MDFQTLLIGISVCLVSALLIYLISLFGMRERTYEEMIAEQRRQHEQISQKVRQDKKEKKKKFKKGKGILEKGQDHTEDKGSQAVEEEEEEETSPQQSQQQEDEAVPKMVELELEPEVIGEEQPRRRGKKNKHKPILINKDEPGLLRAGGHATDLIHRTNPPKDVIELKHEREKQAAPPPSQHMAAGDSAGVQDLTPLPREKKRKDKEIKKEREAVLMPQELPVEHSAMTMMAAAPVEGKRPRKHKDHDHPSEGNTSDGARLLTSVQLTKLSDPDIQALIDLLLSKQSGSTTTTVEWTQTQRGQRGDPTQILKKQLDEREKVLTEQQSAAYTATQRLKELQLDLNNERHKYALLDGQMGDSKQAHVQEIQALHSRMQQTHDSHMQERNHLMMQLEQLKAQCGGDGGQIALQRLTEENQQLKEAVGQAQQMANQAQSMEVANLKNHVDLISSELSKSVADLQMNRGEKKKMEQDLKGMQETIGKLEGKQRDTETVYSKKLNEVTEQLRQEKTNNTKIYQDRDRAKDSAHRAEQDLTNLRNRMKDLEGSNSSNQDTVKALERKLEEADTSRSEAERKSITFEGKLVELESSNSGKDQEMQMLKEENASLASELQSVKQRGTGEGQEASPGPQGVAAPPAEENKLQEEAVQRSTHDKMMSEKDIEMGHLREELSKVLGQLSDMKSELDASKDKNNELRRKNWKAMEAYSEMESRLIDYKTQLESRNSELISMRDKISTMSSVS